MCANSSKVLIYARHLDLIASLATSSRWVQVNWLSVLSSRMLLHCNPEIVRKLPREEVCVNINVQISCLDIMWDLLLLYIHSVHTGCCWLLTVYNLFTSRLSTACSYTIYNYHITAKLYVYIIFYT